MEKSVNHHQDEEPLGFEKPEFDVTSENVVLSNDDAYKINHSFEQAPTGICINLIGAVLFTAWLWKIVPEYVLLPWLFFITTNTAVHFSLINQYKKATNRPRFKRNWAFYNGFLFSIYAISWGIGYHFFFPYLEHSQQIFLFYLAGIYLLSLLPVLSSTHNAYLCTIIAFSIPLLVLVSEKQGNESLIIIGLILCTGFALGFISKKYQNTINQSYLLAMDIKTSSQKLHHEHMEKFNRAYQQKITRHQSETQRIIEQKDHVEKTLTSIGEAIITTDAKGLITSVNPVAEVYLGWEKKHAVGKHIDQILNIFEDTSNQKIHSIFESCVNSFSTVTGSNGTKLLRRDKVEYYIDYSISPIMDSSHNIAGTVMVFRDVTEERGREKILSWQANHDQLTGLINRREFENRLSKILKSNDQSREHALCYIDLDHFKIVNDTCGHQAGDELLKQIAQCLKSKTRDTDTLARLGGDEFGLILYSCSPRKAELLAEIVRKEVEKIDFYYGDQLYKVSASIGVVAITNQFNSLTEILRSADTACYNAKGKGRNKVNILDFTNEFLQKNRNEAENLDTIQACLNREAFLLHHQTIKPVAVGDNEQHCELLIRAEKLNGNILLPDDLLPAAKRYHLMSSIDRWVVRNSFEYIAIDDLSLNPFSIISINLSEQSIGDDSFLEYLLLCYNHYSLSNSDKKICLEIPESSLIERFEQTSRFINTVREQGFLIAIDDFHSGLSSFKKINTLDIEYIKFDGRLNSPVATNNLEHKILKSIIDISHHIGARTIAKYIDSQENMSELEKLGIDYVQGYLVSKPVILPKSTAIDEEFQAVFESS